MKLSIFIIFSTMALFGNCASEKNIKENPESNCFSKENFENVIQYVENKINDSNSDFYLYNENEIHIGDERKTIFLKKKGYSKSIINEKGIYSLNKSAKGNEQMVKEANQLFCELYHLAANEENI